MHDLEEQTGRGEKTNIISNNNSSLRVFHWKIAKKPHHKTQNNSCFPKKAQRGKDVHDTIGIRSSGYISLTDNSELLFWTRHVNLQPNSLQTQTERSTKQHTDFRERPESALALPSSQPCSLHPSTALQSSRSDVRTIWNMPSCQCNNNTCRMYVKCAFFAPLHEIWHKEEKATSHLTGWAKQSLHVGL